MKLEKVEGKKDLLKIEVEGEDHTLLNLLRDECYPTARSASYEQEHPLTSNPTITVTGKNPKKILENALKNVQKLSKEFQNKLK